MLVAKLHRVTVWLKGGSRIHFKTDGLHDSSDNDWPKLSILFATYEKLDKPYNGSSGNEEESWIENPDDIRYGNVELPPKALKRWSSIGAATRIWYTRKGIYADNYKHSYNGKSSNKTPLAALMLKEAKPFEGDLPILYRLGASYRLDLPKGATFNWR